MVRKHLTQFLKWLHQRIWDTKNVWLRALVCWVIGLGFLFVDDSRNFDLRFQLRGIQNPSSEIVVVYLGEKEWADIQGHQQSSLRPLKELRSKADNFYWDKKAWKELLQALLAQSPSAIGITNFFDEDIVREDTNFQRSSIFTHSRIVWAATLDNNGRAHLPVFSRNYGRNTGLIDFHPGDDQTLRRFSSPLVQIPHMSIRLSQLKSENYGTFLTGESRLINFQGPPGTFTSYSASDILKGKVPTSKLKDKIVIVGSRDAAGHLYSTPLGSMSQAEVLANITDNILGDKWIQRPSKQIMALYLLALVILVAWIVFTYPQSVAFVFLFWLSTGLTAVSLWVFDTFYFWTPILASIAQIVTTYIIFLGYQLTLKESMNWRLEQEKKYLYEVEQLKNNFVSLISHDLKTPIAKIQAICDRLLAQSGPGEFKESLSSLRKESAELNRYIQSILRISRVESRAIKLNKEASDINEIIEHIKDQLTPLADSKNVRISLELEPMFAVEIDPILIQEVVLNLMENAIKYTPEEGTVSVTSQELDEKVIVTVTDTGEGVAEQEQKKIFDKFTRGTEHQDTTKGSGLGLYLVKYFIELHGGEVFIKSEKDKGTSIGFRLPVADEDSSNTTGATA